VQQLEEYEPDVARLATGLREETAAIAAAVAGVGPQEVVPTCPEWRVRDLVGHIGQAHRWAARLVRQPHRQGRAAAPVPEPREAGPGHPDEWAGWLAAGADELVDAVAGAGPDTPVWTFLGERPAAFWLRRMLADTTVHHADAALTAGTAPAIAPDLAADAVSEGLGLIAASGAAGLKPELAALRGDGETIALHPQQPGPPGWAITRTPAGVAWERRTAPADVVLTGSVTQVLLVFSRRVPPTEARVTISGDAALLEHWLAHTAF
jgi:uncharacterized protein (TIGR03083 family)